MIPLLMSTTRNNHRPKHRRVMSRHRRRNRKDQIAQGNGRNTIGGRVPITPTRILKLHLLYAQTLLSWTRVMASPPSPRVTTIASGATSTGTGCTGTVGLLTRRHHQHHAPVWPSLWSRNCGDAWPVHSHIHAELTAADHATDHAKFLTRYKQDLIRNAVKSAPMNTASELITNVQDSPLSPTKKIDPKLKESVARLIRHERPKLLTVVSVVCNCVERNSYIGSLKTLVDKSSSKTQYGHTYTACPLLGHNASTASRQFALGHWQGLCWDRVMSNDRLLQHPQPTHC